MVTALQKKIIRDIWENRLPFFAIAGICALGIALFSGLNLYVGTVEDELLDYYGRTALADYWVYKAEFTDSELAAVRRIDNVKDAQLRKAADLFLAGAPGRLRVHALNETPLINIPELLDGQPLNANDTNALLLDSRFAQAHGISTGGRVLTEENGVQTEWFVKGIVRSAEYAYYAPEGLTVPDYDKYGFAYAMAPSLPGTAFNELVLILDENGDTSKDTVMRELRARFENASILGREHQVSCRKMADSLTGVKQIGTLFSTAFFLTGALITGITFSRIMENQRQHLGTLRSLGFSKAVLIGGYTLVGLLITIPSMIIGWIISRFLIADFLYGVMTAYCTIEKTGVAAVTTHFFLAGLCVLTVTCGGTAVSCRKTLALTPAVLMRPKPPAQGHRILLERSTFFWRGLSFSGKIVTRNLFRNKARLIMGIIGIAGSTTLILCGFGLMSSIDAMQRKAFDEIASYDIEIKFRTALTHEQFADITDLLRYAQNIDATMAHSVYIYDKNGGLHSPYLVVMGDMQKSLLFRDRNGNSVSLPQEGVLITPRMAEALDAQPGDMLSAQRTDGVLFALEVAGIADFPVGNEIYMSETAFAKIAEPTPYKRVLLVRGSGFDLDTLEFDPRISLVETKDEMRTNVSTVLEALTGFQIILVVFSGLLAFAVMTVLGRLNYYERIRELATLKVLGFYEREMKRLVLRENIWITLFGLPVGYVISIVLLGIILKQATTPELEIAPAIAIPGIAVGFSFMLAFTVFVNYMLGRKFGSIDMVASLKSIE